MKDIIDCKRILIVGDSCRGKSTMADLLSKNLNIKHQDLDDFFYIKKFTIRREKQEQLDLVKTFLKENNEWIIEGTTRDMMCLCLKDADLIIHLWFKNLLSQLICITKRSFKRKENFWSYLNLCYTTVLKRYKLGKRNKGKLSVRELIREYSYKVINLNSWQDIEKFKNTIIES